MIYEHCVETWILSLSKQQVPETLTLDICPAVGGGDQEFEFRQYRKERTL